MLSPRAASPAGCSEFTQLHCVTAGLEPRPPDPGGWGRLCSAPWHRSCLGKILSGLALNHVKPSAVPDPWDNRGVNRKGRKEEVEMQ